MGFYKEAAGFKNNHLWADYTRQIYVFKEVDEVHHMSIRITRTAEISLYAVGYW